MLQGRRLSILFLALLPLSLAGCSHKSNQQAIDEAAIRATDAGWVKTATDKNVQKTADFYADNAELFVPGTPTAVGHDAIQKLWASMMAVPGFALTFAPSKIQIARSGELAYETGEYALTSIDKSGRPQTSKAKYVVVWGKQSDGSWKALVDAPTTTTF